MAKRNGELQAVIRKFKAAARASEAEHQSMLNRVDQLEDELAREHARYSQASQAAGEQVLEVQCKAQHGYHKFMLRLASALHTDICSS